MPKPSMNLTPSETAARNARDLAERWRAYNKINSAAVELGAALVMLQRSATISEISECRTLTDRTEQLRYRVLRSCQTLETVIEKGQHRSGLAAERNRSAAR